MMHCCFLRDSRTDNVVIEPRYDLGMVPRLKALLPIELNRVGVIKFFIDNLLIIIV